MLDQHLQTIKDLHNRWIGEELAGNRSKLVDFCTDDIQLIPPDAPPVVGKEAVGKYLVASTVQPKAINISNLSIGGNGSFAYLTSSYRTQFLTEGHAGMHEATGNHLWILHKADSGDWRIAVLTWSSW